MSSINQIFLSALGVLAGGLIAVQSALNASLGQRTGNFGSVLLLTFISVIFLIMLIMLFPASANFRNLPGISEWYLYVGGVLGIVILAAPIYLIPRIGTTSTLMAIILGQSIIALLIDQFGILSSPKIEINFARSMGVLLVIIGASLVGRGSFPASVYAIPLIFCLEKFKAIPYPEYIQDTRIRTLLN